MPTEVVAAALGALSLGLLTSVIIWWRERTVRLLRTRALATAMDQSAERLERENDLKEAALHDQVLGVPMHRET
jgi:hypothetical protein